MSRNCKKSIESVLRTKLQSIECPYTINVDDDWISNTLFNPGEQRIRLLQWIFSKFDSRLNDILNPHFALYESKMDSRVQRILMVASSIGFCKYDDVHLIRGVDVNTSRHLAFWEQVINAVCTIDSTEYPQGQTPSFNEQTSQDCSYMDTILRIDKMTALFNSGLYLLPPDIQRKFETTSLSLKEDLKERTPTIDIPALKETAKCVAEDLQNQTDCLQDLVQSNLSINCDVSKQNVASKTIQVILSELNQQMTSYLYSYENEIYLWCNKTQSDLSVLGPAFKRVHSLLQQFVSLLESLRIIRTSYSSIANDADLKTVHILTKNVLHVAASLKRINLASTHMMSFQDCVAVLDESIQRIQHDASCTNSRFHNTKSE